MNYLQETLPIIILALLFTSTLLALAAWTLFRAVESVREEVRAVERELRAMRSGFLEPEGLSQNEEIKAASDLLRSAHFGIPVPKPSITPTHKL